MTGKQIIFAVAAFIATVGLSGIGWSITLLNDDTPFFSKWVGLALLGFFALLVLVATVLVFGPLVFAWLRRKGQNKLNLSIPETIQGERSALMRALHLAETAEERSIFTRRIKRVDEEEARYYEVLRKESYPSRIRELMDLPETESRPAR